MATPKKYTPDVWTARRVNLTNKRNPQAIVDLARRYTRQALKVVIDLMENEEAPPAVRLRAAEVVFERGYGKSPQAILLKDESAPVGGPQQLPILQRIEAMRLALENRAQTTDLEASEQQEVIEGDPDLDDPIEVETSDPEGV